MDKIFGIKLPNVVYQDRKGAYVIPIKDNKVAVVKTSKGYFLLGGGLNPGEKDEECIARECLEEVGCDVLVRNYICSAEAYCEHPEIGYFHPIQRYYSGELLNMRQAPIESDHKLEWVHFNDLKGNLFVEQQNWALEKFLENKA